MARAVNRVTLILLVLSLLGAGGLGYQCYQLTGERSSLQDKVKELEKKAAAVQKRYEEKNALAEQAVRMRTAVEGKARALQGQLEQARSEAQALLQQKDAEIVALREEIKQKGSVSQAVEARIRELAEASRKLASERDELAKKHAQALKGHEAERIRLEGEMRTLDAELKRTQQRVDRCEGNNARLCIIATELLERYEKKGVFGTILQAEPITQFKKVEIEKIVQEYEGRIADERLAKKAETKGMK
jgi:chromosome segregation ATPase